MPLFSQNVNVSEESKRDEGENSEHQERIFYCKGNRALTQVAQRGGGHFIHEDIKKPSGHGPE